MPAPFSRASVRSWCLYDWANSAFATTVMAALLPIYFREVAAGSLASGVFSPGYPASGSEALATSFWGYTSAVSMLVVAVLSLILGPFADFKAIKKRALAGFTILGAVSTAFLSLTGAGDWIWVSVLFIVASVGFGGGEIFYDSLLPSVAGPGELNRISSLGYALGYVGGGILLAVNGVMLLTLPGQTLPGSAASVPMLGMRLSFLSAALWWAVFSLPLFRHVTEPPGVQTAPGKAGALRISVMRLGETFSQIRRYRPLFLFLLAFWFYNDGVGTIMKMATAFGDEIGIGSLDMIGALLLTQVLGFPCSILFGRLADRIGAKRSLFIAILVYMGIAAGGSLMTKPVHFWILAFMVGLVQGGIQALSRSLYASMVPRSRTAEFFSFFNISGKFAGILGPAVFALAGQLAGSSRLGVLSLTFFFAAGIFLLFFVDVEEGRKEAQAVREGESGRSS